LTLQLVDHLVETLNNKCVVYCHWKSNYALTQALDGKTDLDLLVERKSLSQVIAILMDFGFKPAVVRGGPGTPGVSHWYGLDPQTGQLVHVHMFSRVVTGESLVKSHLLPFEPMLLENTDFIGPIRVTAKPAEMVVFVMRTFIKYGSLLDLMVLRRNPEAIQTELRWLQDGSDLSEALCLLKEYCPVIGEPLFTKCINTLQQPGSLVKRISLARQVRRGLRVYARHTSFNRLLAHLQLLGTQVQRRLGGNRRNKMLQAGGTIIAFVGPEATGKSTLVSACGSWLGNTFAVRTVHAGKPPSSWLTLPVNAILPLARSVLPRSRASRLEAHNSSTNPTHSEPKDEGLPALIHALRAVALAWDRRQLLLRVRRSAANGEIVISDRYPSEAIGAMDSPRLRQDRTKSGLMSAIHHRLARLEHRLYKQIPPPDVVLRLKVSTETAIMRNRERTKAGDETDAYVESRHREDRGWYRTGTKYIYDIDTEQPLAETIRSVKKLIWESL
jgi:thymidylate kinase